MCKVATWPGRRVCTTSHSISLLQKYLVADETTTDPVVFVAIDLGFNAAGTQINTIGIVTLDTLELGNGCEIDTILRTQNYVTKDILRPYHASKSAPDPKAFLFGESKRVLPAEIRALFERTFAHFAPENECRKLIVVGHGMHQDLKAMRDIGIDLLDEEKFPSILGILDTERMAYHLAVDKKLRLQPRGGFVLNQLITDLGIPYQKNAFHNSGNDANFTMRALLTMTVGVLEMREDMSSEIMAKCRMLKSIAAAPLPKGRTPDCCRYREIVTHKKAVKTAIKKAIKAARPEDWLDVVDWELGFSFDEEPGYDLTTAPRVPVGMAPD